MKYNIAIDGPAGAGKSTIAKKLAKDLGYIYVDTGAMYRAMAYYFLMNNIKSDDVEMISKACQNVEISIVYKDGEQQVILNGENINAYIREEKVGNMASATSVYPVVREKLVELQRQLAKRENSRITILPDKETEVADILANSPAFIDRPLQHEYFQRKYGIEKIHET